MPASPDLTTDRRIALLAGQAFCLGLMTAWIAIPASAIFLQVYGSGLLPITYIGAAVAGAATSVLRTAALRRHPLVTVAMGTLAVLAVGLLASWLLIWRLRTDWLSFALVVLVPLVVPVGFMLVVAQAGMLLDVRALKSLYSRVIAGFALGFMIGGLAGPPLLTVLGRTEHLLAGGAAAAVVFVLLVAKTRRNFLAELSVVDDVSSPDLERPTLRSLFRYRYVVLIVGFQMLSAVESQWLDYLVYDRAGKRYTDTEELARFISRFMAIAYGVDIIFLLIVAGALMRSFGLRYGLTANPLTVLGLVVAIITAATIQGSGTTIVFVLIVASRVSDLVLSDGTTRTSVSAAYQTVPTHVRLATQAMVEGLAVPVAIGVSGLVLIVLRSTVGTGGLALPLLTSAVVVAWTIVALYMYRDYRVNLLVNLRQRLLDPAELTIEGASTLAAIHRLVDSADERDVRLGLDTLTAAEHPDLSAHLVRLAHDGRVGVRCNALDRLGQIDASAAAMAARHGLNHPSHEIRAASLRTLATSGDGSDCDAIATCLDDASDDVRVAAVVAMSKIGGASARRQIGLQIESLCRAESSDCLMLAARMLDGCGPVDWIDRRPLRTMLEADDQRVVNAALAAIRSPHDRGLLGDVVKHLGNRTTARAAAEALARTGDLALDLADQGLRGHFPLGQHGHEQLTRVCRMIGGSSAAAVLRRHAAHRDREVGLAVMNALAAIGVTGPDLNEAELRNDLEHATHVLQAIQVLQYSESTEVLRAALRDEQELLSERILAGLAVRYGTDELSRIGFQLTQHDTRFHAFAMEWLDATLTGIDRAAVALLEPELSTDERLTILTRWFTISPTTPYGVLVDLAEDRDDHWRRPWISACALLAASGMPEFDAKTLATVRARVAGVDDFDDHFQIVRETIAGIVVRQPV